MGGKKDIFLELDDERERKFLFYTDILRISFPYAKIIYE